LINNLKELSRKRYGKVLTQREMEAVTGISQSTISRWYNNKIDRFDSATILKLCRHFDCDLHELLTIDKSGDQAS
jgi:DNA-binding Xre family transcriptional regulator